MQHGLRLLRCHDLLLGGRRILFLLKPRKWSCIHLLVDLLPLLLSEGRGRLLVWRGRWRGRRQHRRLWREVARVDIANTHEKFVCISNCTYMARP